MNTRIVFHSQTSKQTIKMQHSIKLFQEENLFQKMIIMMISVIVDLTRHISAFPKPCYTMYKGSTKLYMNWFIPKHSSGYGCHSARILKFDKLLD